MKSERLQKLNQKPCQSGTYVLYWMQQSQRARWNHALEYAIRQANTLDVPVLVGFGITQRFPGANERHYHFMLQGLRQTINHLRDRGIHIVVRMRPPAELIPDLASEAAMVVTDRGYLRIQKRWRERVARNIPCRLVQVETDAVVPVNLVSEQEEYAARTLRPKISEHLPDYLRPVEHTEPSHDSLHLNNRSMQLENLDGLLQEMQISRDARPVETLHGGPDNAHAHLENFVTNKLSRYANDSSDPTKNCVSHLSPYLHFGQISPVEVALTVDGADDVSEENRDAFLEQLIVRRELAFNFCEYNPHYDRYTCLPDWARETLQDHADDEREYSYSKKELEDAETHDPYWNAAQKRLVDTGYMHNYMRMYWGKKILEWTPDPESAFETALLLNNRYELDGRDPCSFANVAWCFGKHDQGWKEREVFGKVRYMNANGLERKFEMDLYLENTRRILSEDDTSLP